MAGQTAAFDLPGDQRGVLLVHGFTGTPFEMRPLAERMNARGMTTAVLRLPGHGTTPAELDVTPATEWFAEVERGLHDLRSRCRTVAVVGQSLGALIALHLAVRRGAALAALVTLGAPMRLMPAAAALVAALRLAPRRLRLPPLPKGDGSDVADRRMWARNPSYPVVPLRALVEFDDFRQLVRGQLERVTTPLLVVHALHDHVAPFASADEIARRVRSPVVERLTLPRSFHLVSMDVERDRVGAVVGDFLTRHLSGADA